MNELVEVDVEVITETENAYLIFDGTRESWVPKSLVKDYTEKPDGTISSIFVSEFIAMEKRFI